MIDIFDNDYLGSFEEIIDNYTLVFANHIKSLFRVNILGNWIHPHHPEVRDGVKAVVNCEGIVDHNYKSDLRAISSRTFQDHVLVHLHTRSITNLMMKAFNTHLDGKRVSNHDQTVIMINAFTGNESQNELRQDFLNHIGVKAHLCLNRRLHPVYRIKELGYNLKFEGLPNFVDTELQQRDIERHFPEQLNMQKYEQWSKKMAEVFNPAVQGRQ